MSRTYDDDDDGYFEPTRRQPIKRAVNGRSYNDDDFDDDDRDRIEIDEVVRLLKANVYYGDGLRANAVTLQKWLNGSEEFSEAWHEFTGSGGISADDFRSFMNGTFRARLTRRKKHLRLVATTKAPRIRLRR